MLFRSWHSLMHICRESLLRFQHQFPVLFLRICAIYGPSDKHNSYGPNRFLNQALDGVIQISGKGAELRNHLYIEDLVRIIELFISKKALGTYNVANSAPVSFLEIAEIVASISGASIEHLFANGDASKLKGISVERMNSLFGNEYIETPLTLGIKETYFAKLHKKAGP